MRRLTFDSIYIPKHGIGYPNAPLVFFKPLIRLRKPQIVEVIIGSHSVILAQNVEKGIIAGTY